MLELKINGYIEIINLRLIRAFRLLDESNTIELDTFNGRISLTYIHKLDCINEFNKLTKYINSNKVHKSLCYRAERFTDA